MSSVDYTITVQQGDPPVIVASGEFDYRSAPGISRAFADLEALGHVRIDLDCEGVDFVDSSGLGAIVHAAQRLKSAGGGLTLRAASRQVLHAFQTSGFSGMMDTSPAEAAAATPTRTQPPPGACQRCSFSLPVRPGTTCQARRRVTEFVEAMAFSREQIDDINLAVGEALANAVRHGCPDPERDCVVVRCSGDCDKVVISVSNPGEAFDADAVPVPVPENVREGGMGIFFMRHSMDDVTYTFDGRGTTVTMTKFIDSTNRMDNGSNRKG